MYLPCRLHLVRCYIIQCQSCHIAPHRSCESHIGWDRRCGLHIAGPNLLKGFHRCDCPSEKFSHKSPEFLLKRCVTLCLRFLLKKIAFWDWNHGQTHFFQHNWKKVPPAYAKQVFLLKLIISESNWQPSMMPASFLLILAKKILRSTSKNQRQKKILCSVCTVDSPRQRPMVGYHTILCRIPYW